MNFSSHYPLLLPGRRCTLELSNDLINIHSPSWHRGTDQVKNNKPNPKIRFEHMYDIKLNHPMGLTSPSLYSISNINHSFENLR